MAIPISLFLFVPIVCNKFLEVVLILYGLKSKLLISVMCLMVLGESLSKLSLSINRLYHLFRWIKLNGLERLAIEGILKI